MRVLFTHQPGSGHWHPLVPLARTLQARGHDLAFASTPAAEQSITATGFRFFPAGVDETPEILQERQRLALTLPPREAANRTQTRAFAGALAERSLPDLLQIVSDWRPDVIVRETCEYGGYLVAEYAQIPHATVQVTAMRAGLDALVAEPLNNHRASLGLPPVHDPHYLAKYLFLTPRPPILWVNDIEMPPTTHCFRYTGFNQSGEESLPAWVQSLPPRPTIYASLGTVFNQVPGLMSAILEALRHEPVNLIISVGRNGDPSIFGEQPPHVHIERYIPQELLLPHCDLVITQAGSGTMMDTLSHGLPMVMLPIAADQPENAQRCAEIGVAAVLGREARTPTDIRDAAREVLNNPTYRRNAQQVQQEIQALPGLDHAAGLLERLAVERAPILS